MKENSKWNDIKKITIKLLVLFIPFFTILPLYCALFPSYYMDSEYAMYKQQRDYNTKNTEYNEVLILGDSRAKAGFVPDYLGESCYNISLGGATPIEGYYSLKEYLNNHKKPKTLIISYAPMHYMDVDTFWTRSVYFHNVSHDDFMEIINTAKLFNDTEHILIENYYIEYLMYMTYMPNKYMTALKKSGFLFRHNEITEKYDSAAEKRGQSYYGLLDGSDSFNGEAKVTDFKNSDIITYYFEQILGLCREEGIQVIVEHMPMNEISYGVITKEFKEHFKEFILKEQYEYPEVVFAPKLYCYPNEYFGDADHLNIKGTQKFCNEFIKKIDD